MKKHLIYTVTGMLLISLFAGLASGQDVVIEMPPTREAFDTEEFTKLEISPRYGHLQLQPGTSKELTVTIKNKEEETITVSPHVVVSPYREYLFDEEWISISPESQEISAGGSHVISLSFATSTSREISRKIETVPRNSSPRTMGAGWIEITRPSSSSSCSARNAILPIEAGFWLQARIASAQRVPPAP